MYKIILLILILSLTILHSADKPHILYINADDLGVMDVGYNNQKFNTPNIDLLAKEGMVFTNGYAPSANCAPSRACVHSGQWSARHGVYTVGSSQRGKSQTRKLIPVQNTRLLPNGMTTMATALKKGGYKTIHLGKYHITENPLTSGFDINIGGDESGSPAGGYFSPWKTGSMKKYSEKYPKGTHRIDIYAEEATKFIAENKSTPMFIHFSPYMVHTPLQPVPEFIGKYKDKDVHPVYASMVEKFDQAVGKVLKAIEDNALTDKFIVVFSSDNGGIAAISSQNPYRAGKGSYYEGGVREPFVARWPGKIKAGSTCDTPVCTIDLYPTFLKAADLKAPENHKLDGVSLLPLMKQSGDIEKRALYWHFPVYLQAYKGALDDARDPLFRTRPGSAMRLGKWKLHHYFEDDTYELYDLSSDTGERKNLASAMPEKLAELKKMLDAWRADIKAPIPTELNPEYNPNFKPQNKPKKKKKKK